MATVGEELRGGEDKGKQTLCLEHHLFLRLPILVCPWISSPLRWTWIRSTSWEYRLLDRAIMVAMEAYMLAPLWKGERAVLAADDSQSVHRPKSLLFNNLLLQRSCRARWSDRAGRYDIASERHKFWKYVQRWSCSCVTRSSSKTWVRKAWLLSILVTWCNRSAYY